jgi:hypothetical protein
VGRDNKRQVRITHTHTKGAREIRFTHTHTHTHPNTHTQTHTQTGRDRERRERERRSEERYGRFCTEPEPDMLKWDYTGSPEIFNLLRPVSMVATRLVAPVILRDF